MQVRESVKRKLAELERKMADIHAERELVQAASPFSGGQEGKKSDMRRPREAAPKKFVNLKEKDDGGKDWRESESDTEDEDCEEYGASEGSESDTEVDAEDSTSSEGSEGSESEME